MATYNVLEAKTHLSRLIEAVESGRESEIIIARNGKPAAKLTPITDKPARRQLGLARGKWKIPDDIDGDNDLIAASFSGSDV
ncbi:MAG TPA: type II toxin-antitoxin system prevent-host-death family antitoxin [Caulobacteraceae bacterium]|jgi:prevent-host-death family protein